MIYRRVYLDPDDIRSVDVLPYMESENGGIYRVVWTQYGIPVGGEPGTYFTLEDPNQRLEMMGKASDCSAAMPEEWL